MSSKGKLSLRSKREIMIAVLLTACLLLGVAVLMLVEDSVGTPVFYDGEMKNICVRINEICASNRSIIATDQGEFHDYIELYNYGETFNLADFGLSNESGNGVSYKFGDITFKAGTYLVVYLDGINVPFRLNSDGNEYISLVSWDGTVIDKATTVATSPDEVMLWNKEGFALSEKASPGYPNTDEGVAQFMAGLTDGDMALSINEIFISNRATLPDYEGEYCDVIELKNVSNSIISLKGYFISDSLSDRLSCALPDVELAPGELFLVYASGKDTDKKGEFHASFRVSEGEDIVISSGAKHFSQSATACGSGYSQSRVMGESGYVYTSMLATPGFENSDAGIEAFELSRIDTDAKLVINELLLSSDGISYGGKLRDVIEIMNISEETVSTKGWYISDSTDDPYRFALPEKELAPNECLLLYAENGSGKSICGFGLSSGESVYLTTPNNKRSDYVSCANAGIGRSRSRIIENGEAIYVDGDITLGFANDDSGKLNYAKSVRPAEVEISEAVPLNKQYLAGPYKTYHDFVELHNRTDSEIDLTGWYLSDNSEEPRKGSLDGVTVPANGYVVIILSSEGINTPSGYKVLDFGLSSSGETLCLSKGDETVDCVYIPQVGQNTAYGRPDGRDEFTLLASVTPNAKNSAEATAVTPEPTASLAQGVYSDTSITLEFSGEGNIYYTLDCSEPTSASTRYTSPITLTKTTVIRCFALADGKKMSKISDLTYVINEPDTLETITIVTTPENLWDHYSGIYATGPNAAAEFPYNGANYYNRWEREATVSFFDKNGGGFSEYCGIRIFGGLSRALPKKSFAVFFRSSYGNGQLNYQLFEDDDLSVYEAFVLRNTGQDWKYTQMRDAMITTMANEMLGIDVQNCRPVVVYLNGEYWGLYFIREKLNENYVAGHYNVDASEAEVAVANGHTSADYKALVSFASSNDMTVKENYEYVCSLMDVENYADYIAAQMIIANTDNGNIRFFTYEGGKWRWIMYDVDQSFRAAYFDTVEDHLNPNGTGGGNNFSTRLINALLTNPEFKDMFLTKMAWQMNNVWSVENVNAYIDIFAGMIQNDVARDRIRWERDYESWVTAVESLRTFIKARGAYMLEDVQNYFSLTDSQMRAYGFNI